uniref:Histone-lysine N-methyltransferase SUVR2 n=1 Tax=Noccaea caerulescens TaxID=107243 RepID=A0A1J3HC30_NOCCA
MPPSHHVKKAYAAMEALGIDPARVKPVLKNLLATYEKNWELIAEDNYSVLADAIFDEKETEATQEMKEKKKKPEEAECSAAEVDRGKKKVHELAEEDEDYMDETEPPLKRLRRRGEGGSALTLNKSTSPSLGSPTSNELTTYNNDTAPILLPYYPLPTENDPDAGALIIPKDETLTDVSSSPIHPVERGNSSNPILEMEKTNGHVDEQDGETVSAVQVTTKDVPPTTIERFSEQNLAATQAESSALELASSASGEVKINLSFAPATGGSSLRLPSEEELRRAMEDKCLRSYKILDPNFSVVGFLNDICSCYLDLATKANSSANQSPENLPVFTTNVDVLKNSAARMDFASSIISDHNVDALNKPAARMELMISDDHTREDGNGAAGDSMGLVAVPECQASADEYRLLSNVSDITLGRETVEIPWVNEVNDKVPPSFFYIPQSLVYQDAEVKFTVGNIRDDQCCSSCCGDCLALSMACSCAAAPNGFAYAVGGLLQSDFLEECISEARDPRKHVVLYCKECPLEKAKNEDTLEKCKGHLKRKVIKECWSKCRCNKRCGNRVVQHGIHNKLQVFFTPNWKGWGLRTLEKLPKGVFVCEFAGEILTVTELCQRSKEKVTCPVILDAHWGSEELLGDNKSLCLDGTQYGNISRFINHRCLDANLIEIPVHVENTEPHYYHLAFFTTREIDAMEELTWDYGVEFNDNVYPTTPFHCRCGSEFCRNIKPPITKTKKTKKRA